MMKAIVIKEFVQNYSDLRATSTPVPKPKANEVLVRVSRAGLNYVDLLYCRGKHQNNTSLVRPPFTLGLEFAGTVLSAPATSSFKPGDPVFGGGLGAYAEQITVSEDSIRRIPDGWSLDDAAGLSATAPVSYGALVRVAKVKQGETVLVHAAAGGLGVMAVQIAHAVGARVVATVGSEEKAEVVRRLGVQHVVLYNQEGWEKKVLEATGGQEVDVVFDPVGLIEKSIRCTKYRGRIIIVGFAGREGNLEKIAANRILLKGITVIGYRYGEDGRRSPGETAAIWEGLTDLLNHKMIKPVIYNVPFKGLESVSAAMQSMAARKVWGKAVIQIDARKNDVKL